MKLAPKTYRKAEKEVAAVQRKLGVTDSNSRVFITFHGGMAKPGYRVNVVRLRDGVAETVFVKTVKRW